MKRSASVAPATPSALSAEGPSPRIGLVQIFLAFMAIGLSGFGGVLPIARHALVERRAWLSPQEFTELLGLCQLVPGPNIVNLSICFGTRAAGVPGAAAAFLGLLLMPVLVVLCLAEAYAMVSDLPETVRAFQAVGAAAAGLIVAMALRMMRPLLDSPLAAALAAIVFAAMVVFHISLVWVVIVMAPTSILVTWLRRP